jgi:CubicO group peptidase (beta-lactamase class C family)
MDRRHVHGVAATVLDASGSHSHAWGVAPDAIFEAASMGKAVTGYVTLALVAQGSIELDVPLVRYSRRLAPDDDRIEIVTARHALTHRSGLWCDQNPGPLYFEKDPDGEFKYSNAGSTCCKRTPVCGSARSSSGRCPDGSIRLSAGSSIRGS